MVLLSFAIGAILGALTTATAAWSLGGLFKVIPLEGRTALWIAVASIGLLRDTGVLSFQLPHRDWQVPRDAFSGTFWVGALHFGYELGLGFRTFVTSTLPYVLLAFILLMAPSLLSAFAAGAGFGLSRGLVPTLRAVSPVARPAWDELLESHGRLLVGTASAAFVGLSAAYLSTGFLVK